MKAGLFYTFFLLFSLMLVTATQNKEKHESNSISSCQSFDVNTTINSIVPDINFRIKKNFPVINNFEPFNQCHFIKVQIHMEKPALTFLKLCRIKRVDLKPAKSGTYRPRLYHSPGKPDEHYLSC